MNFNAQGDNDFLENNVHRKTVQPLWSALTLGWVFF